jgi:endonuclease/exonuclease/phosphatase family metal-dependent hydrolase
MRKKQYSGQVVFFLVILIFLLLLISCTHCVLPGSGDFQNRIVFMSYNTQNIFDDIDNGTEYPEFDPSGSDWGTSQYNTRLFNLSEVIRRSIRGGPDIIALQEIENKKVVADLVAGYLKGMGYNFSVVTETQESAIQLGFISRLELNNMKVHRVQSNGKTIGRPILEISVITDNSVIHVFNNHWKSKLGGAEETEPARIASAAVLGRRLKEIELQYENPGIVILGDLNENWDEYSKNNGEYITALIPQESLPVTDMSRSIIISGTDFAEQQNSEHMLLYSPWCTYSNNHGSYVYNNSWETIDHVLLNRQMFNGSEFDYKSFNVVRDDYLLNIRETPLSWNTDLGTGYSDHLPLLLILER